MTTEQSKQSADSTSDAALNFSVMRAKHDKLLAEKNQAVAEAERLRSQLASFSGQSLLGEAGVSENDYVDGKGVASVVNTAANKQAEAMKEYIAKAVSEGIKQDKEANLYETFQMRTNNDFGAVVTEASVKKLKEESPHLAHAANMFSDKADQFEYLYKVIKEKQQAEDDRMSINKEISRLSSQGKLSENLLTLSSPSGGGSPLHYDLTTDKYGQCPGLERMVQDEKKGLISAKDIADLISQRAAFGKRKYF